MKNSILIVALLSVLTVSAQESPLYVAAKGGLNIREKAEANARVLDKIPYGTKINLLPMEENSKKVTTEGLTGYWRKVTYNNKTGYIIDAYLLPFAPPKADVKSMKAYLAQLSAPFGSRLTVKTGAEDMVATTHKQLYKNGGEYHQFIGYEYNSDTYFLPQFSMQQGFLLVRMMAEFAEVWSEKDALPTTDTTCKKGEREYSITVQKEVFGDTPWIKRIKVEFESGAMYTFEMYEVDNQLVIFYGAGV